MSRSGADRARRLGSLVLVALLSCALGAGAQGSDPAPAESGNGRQEFPVEHEARVILSRLQSEWLEWLTAINAGDQAAAKAAVDNLVSYAGQVAMPRLPELALAAAERAVEAARAGQPDRASWALGAAERLAPGLPEIAFARAELARSRGSFPVAAWAQARGYGRALVGGDHRQRLLQVQGRWAVQVAILALLVFSGLQMVARGSRLYRDLVVAIGRYLPVLVVHPLIWALALWPILLPSGWLWLALYWTALFWTYGGWFERSVFLLTWLAALAGPLFLDRQSRLLESTPEPAVRALVWAADGRLGGSLLSDSSLLLREQGENPAVVHAAADLQRRLGQCEAARQLYVRVLRQEPDNVGALADLGACLYDGGLYEQALDSLQLAADREPQNPAVQFNLSQALSEVYRFGEAESALRTARQIDAERVNQWMRDENPRLVIPLDRGLARARELASASRSAQSGGLGSGWQVATLPAAMAAASLLVGFLVAFLLRRAPHRSPASGARWFPGAAEMARRVLLPGVPEAEAEEWVRALLHATVAVGLISLPWVDRFGPAVGWGYQPGRELHLLAAGLGVAALLAVRWLQQRRRPI